MRIPWLPGHPDTPWPNSLTQPTSIYILRPMLRRVISPKYRLIPFLYLAACQHTRLGPQWLQWYRRCTICKSEWLSIANTSPACPKRMQTMCMICSHPHLHRRGTLLAICYRYVTLSFPHHTFTIDWLRIGLIRLLWSSQRCQMRCSLFHHPPRYLHTLGCATTQPALTYTDMFSPRWAALLPLVPGHPPPLCM